MNELLACAGLPPTFFACYFHLVQDSIVYASFPYYLAAAHALSELKENTLNFQLLLHYYFEILHTIGIIFHRLSKEWFLYF